MMTYEMYRYLFLGGAAMAGVMLIVTVALFFAFNIPKIIGLLTGATARKAIKQIRFQSEGYSERIGRAALGNPRGKTDALPGAIRTQRQANGTKRTEKIETGTLVQNAQGPWQTEPAAETSVLQPPASAPAAETSVLQPFEAAPEAEPAYYGETSVLDQGPAMESAAYSAPPQDTYASGRFEVEYDITFLHSDVVIP